MNPVNIFKTVAAIAVSSGAGAIVGNTVKLTTPSDVKLVSKITIAAGSLALSGLVSDVASKYTEAEIEKAVEQVKNLKKLVFKK